MSLYRGLIRHGKQFSNYNFKEYVLRRAREDFRLNRSASAAEVRGRPHVRDAAAWLFGREGKAGGER